MFTGLVLEVGTVARVSAVGGKSELEITAPKLASGFALGDSVSVNGACQTVVRTGTRSFVVEALAETMKKTTLGSLRPGVRVNLEPAITASTPLGGHLVQGHINEAARVSEIREDSDNVYFSVELSESSARYCVAEGSICIDGVSLTIARLAGKVVTINIIPHTWAATALAERRVGDFVNIETDIIARYVERFIQAQLPGSKEAHTDTGSATPVPPSLDARFAGWGYEK